MPLDLAPFVPANGRPDSPYNRMQILHDDGLCHLMGAMVVHGLVLNQACVLPYYSARRVYLVMDGKIQAMPEQES